MKIEPVEPRQRIYQIEVFFDAESRVGAGIDSIPRLSDYGDKTVRETCVASTRADMERQLSEKHPAARYFHILSSSKVEV